MPLKRCPFCGGKAEIFQHRSFGYPDFGMYSVACESLDCFASGGGMSYPTEHDAAEAWNRRAGEENVQA